MEKMSVLKATGSGAWLPGEELLQAARAAVEQQGELLVDVSGVEYMGAEALQILLALGRNRRDRGLRFSLTQVSPSLQAALEGAGAARWFVAERSADG